MCSVHCSFGLGAGGGKAPKPGGGTLNDGIMGGNAAIGGTCTGGNKGGVPMPGGTNAGGGMLGSAGSYIIKIKICTIGISFMV